MPPFWIVVQILIVICVFDLGGDRRRQAVTVAQPTTPAEPDYGPSLPQIVGPWLRARPRWQQIALGLAVVLLAGRVAALTIRSAAEVKTYHQTESDARDRGLNPIQFHFDHSRKLKISQPPGAYVRAERRRNGSWWPA